MFKDMGLEESLLLLFDSTGFVWVVECQAPCTAGSEWGFPWPPSFPGNLFISKEIPLPKNGNYFPWDQIWPLRNRRLRKSNLVNFCFSYIVNKTELLRISGKSHGAHRSPPTAYGLRSWIDRGGDMGPGQDDCQNLCLLLPVWTSRVTAGGVQLGRDWMRYWD